jgi:hypothetical protein
MISAVVPHRVCHTEPTKLPPALLCVAARPGWSLRTVAPSPSSQHSSDLESPSSMLPLRLSSPSALRGAMPAVGIIHSTHLQHQAHGHL